MTLTQATWLRCQHVGSGYFGSTGPWLATRHRLSRAVVFMLAAAWLLPAAAQGNEQFNVTVKPSSSQRQVGTQGATTIFASTTQLRALERITEHLRDTRDYRRSSGQESASTAAASLRLVGLFLSEAGSSESASDVAFGRWNSFSNLEYSFGDHDGTTYTPAHDISMIGWLAGADYRLSSDVVVGVSLGYLKSKNDYFTNTGELELDGYSLSGLGVWYILPSWYVDGLARIGWNEYNTNRPTSGGIAHGDSDGAQFTLSLGSGYEFHRGGLSMGPRVRFKYTKANIDAYREHGPAALVYEDQDIQSLTSNIGFEATYAVNTDFGVVVPQFNLEWTHEFKADPDAVAARLAAGGARFLVPVDHRDEDFYRAGLGASVILSAGRIVYLWYETALSRAHRDEHTITLGVRLEL